MTGFYKAIVYSPEIEGRRLVDFVHINRRGGSLVKTASEREYSPEVMSLVRDLEPEPGKICCLISAMGASPAWVANSNGDDFPEEQLVPPDGSTAYGYKTFEMFARPFKHHINKADSPSYGDVLHSIWNPRMKRVELIVKIDCNKAPDIAEQVDAGEDVPVSMGCRVPFDICSICGNRAKKVEEYCDDAKNRMGEILPDGRRVRVINIRPKFFDISFVFVGADKTARVMAKLANGRCGVVFPSGLWAPKLGYVDKGAEIFKEIPAIAEKAPLPDSVTSKIDAGVKELSKREEPIDKKTLSKAASGGLNDALAAFTQCGIVLSPSEFQYAALCASGNEKLAVELSAANAVFDENDYDQSELDSASSGMDLGPRKLAGAVLDAVIPWLEKRSSLFPFLAQRLSSDSEYLGAAPPEPQAPSVNGVLPVLGLLATLYAAYRNKVPGAGTGNLDELVANNPQLLALLAGLTGGGVIGANALLNKMSSEKTAVSDLARVLGIPALVYMYSGHQQRKRWRGEQLGPVDTLLADYPWLPAVAGVGMTHGWSKTSSEIRNLVSSGSRDTVISRGRLLSDYQATLNLLKLADRPGRYASQ